MADGRAIHVTGWADFNRGLRAMDRDAPKGLRVAANKSADIIVGVARPRVPLGPARGGHVRPTVRAASTRTAARVSGGGKRFGYFGWLEFGGDTGRGQSVHRPYIRRGRYIWAAFAENRPVVLATLERELVAVAEHAGVKVT